MGNITKKISYYLKESKPNSRLAQLKFSTDDADIQKWDFFKGYNSILIKINGVLYICDTDTIDYEDRHLVGEVWRNEDKNTIKKIVKNKIVLHKIKDYDFYESYWNKNMIREFIENYVPRKFPEYVPYFKERFKELYD